MGIADRETILALVNALPEGRAKHRYEQMLDTACERKSGEESIREPQGENLLLFRALAHKENELRKTRAELASVCQTDQEWTQEKIAHLQAQTEEVKRYVAEGGNLQLPSCCRDGTLVCSVALRGFNSCIFLPSECGFGLRL